MTKTYVGTCTHCNKSAQWNSPALDPQDNLWCDGCADADRSNIVFRTIQQFKADGEYVLTGGVVLNGVVVWKDNSTWVEGGSRSVKLTKEEETMTPLEIAKLLNEEHNIKGLWRCTSNGCGAKMKFDDVAGWPLFAGCCCASCWKKHQSHLDDQSKKGHSCGMCGKPYDACYC